MPQTPVMLHTHWDREWYESAATFRVRLASVMADVLERLESGELPAFTLDGQTALIEDYVALVPEEKSRIAALVKAGKLHVGPWFTAPDSWLVSGESLLRNLALGIQQATELGETAFTGYLPDTFGHPRDIPTLLSHMGLDTAMVWRGVAKSHPSPFVWQGQDAEAKVLTTHLREGYFHPMLHDATLSDTEKTERLLALAETLSRDSVPALLPIGGDHLGALPNESWQLLQDTLGDVSVVSPAGYMATISGQCAEKTVPSVGGALMDNTDAYLLTGVWSARTELKQANRLAQHRLVHQLEPLLVWVKMQAAKNSYAAERWVQWHRLWQQAWKTLLLNHPHDSICGCSTDAVHTENRVRFQQINDTIDALMAQLEAFGAGYDRARQDPNAGGEETMDPPVATVTQAAVFSPWPSASPNLPNETQAGRVVPITATGTQAVLALQQSIGAQVTSKQTILANGYRTDALQIPLSHLTVPQAKGWLWLPEDHPEGMVTALDVTTAEASPIPVQAAQVALSVRLVSALVSCHVTPGQQGLHIASPYGGWTVRLTWQADEGDSYNRCPVPPYTVHKARCVEATVIESGPLVCSCQSQWVWDEVTGAAPVTLICQLTAGSPVVQMQWHWKTPLPNGLVQCVVDTHRPVQQVWTDAHLGVEGHAVDTTRDWLNELPAKTFKEVLPNSVAMQRYVVANGCWVITDGAPEVEVSGSTLSMSLHRTFAAISRGTMATRGGAAGPPVPTPEVQSGQRPLCATLGVATVPQSVVSKGQWIHWAESQAMAFDGAAWAIMRDGAAMPEQGLQGPLVTLSHPDLMLTACKPTEDGTGWLIRVLNTSAHSVKGVLAFGQSVSKIWSSNGLEECVTPVTLTAPYETLPLDWRPYQLRSFRML